MVCNGLLDICLQEGPWRASGGGQAVQILQRLHIANMVSVVHAIECPHSSIDPFHLCLSLCDAHWTLSVELFRLFRLSALLLVFRRGGVGGLLCCGARCACTVMVDRDAQCFGLGAAPGSVTGGGERLCVGPPSGW